MTQTLKVAVLGASGYTGSDALRLLLAHPLIEVTHLTASRKAGLAIGDIFPHLGIYDLPQLQKVEDIDWAKVTPDFILCCLPHATSQAIIAKLSAELPARVKFVDLSADFRLRNPETYAEWYGNSHSAVELQKQAVYGLSEWYRADIAEARLVACPGCYPTAALLGLIPLVQAGLIDPNRITIDAKSGVTGAGRSLKENLLFTEVAEAMNPYAVGRHRHMPEIEQELAVAARVDDLRISFTPHLVPMNRGELLTVYVERQKALSTADLKSHLQSVYDDAAFVHVLPEGQDPATRRVRGSNHVVIQAYEDRIDGRSIISVALDNLVKGSSGQALQNMNIMAGFNETLGLGQVALFP